MLKYTKSWWKSEVQQYVGFSDFYEHLHFLNVSH